MAEYTALWLVSPIKRTVDDKAAKDLLGKSSRIQLKMDGLCKLCTPPSPHILVTLLIFGLLQDSNITFICTGTDAFDIRAVQESLDHDGRIAEIQKRKAELSVTIARKHAAIESLGKKVDELYHQCNASEEALREWNRISTQCKQGHQVYAPAPAPAALCPPPPKRQKLTAQESTTEDEIEKRLADVKEQRNGNIDKYNAALDQLGQEETTEATMEQEMARCTDQVYELCVQLRNQWCKKAIRKDFAAGMREEDEEADQQDDANSDTSKSQRELEDLARGLAVFTISSRAYREQCLTPTERREVVNGFASPEHTEIPALRAHAKSMTKARQIKELEAFLNEVIQILGYIQICVHDTDDDIARSSQIGAQEITDVVTLLENENARLKEKVSKEMLELKNSLLSIVHKFHTCKYSGALKHAKKSIGDIVLSWSAKEGERVGKLKGVGMHVATYKATCRRYGNTTRSKRSRDFNKELSVPFLDKIKGAWNETFEVTIPYVLDVYEDMLARFLRAFHEQAVSGPAWANTKNVSLRLLQHQLQDHNAAVKEVMKIAKDDIQSGHRGASRSFHEEVQRQMKSVYEMCAKEKCRLSTSPIYVITSMKY